METKSDPALSDYYYENLEASCEYMDWLSSTLLPHGIILQNMCSRNFQLKMENLQGIEIKFDRQMGKTNNLWLEAYEKREATQELWVPTGILKDDNAWLFAIGNYGTLYIFSKKQLQKAFNLITVSPKNHPWLNRVILWENKKKTSRGLIVPRTIADIWAEKVFRFIP